MFWIYVFCDSQLWTCDDRNICMISWFCEPVMSWWTLPWHLNNLRQWWILPWRLNNLRSCELRRCGWGTTTWNSGFMLFETKLAGIDTFRCLRRGSKFCQSRLVCTTWICWISFWQWPILFWPSEWNQNSLNGSVNWVCCSLRVSTFVSRDRVQVKTSLLYWMLFVS